ncbi:MAG: aspartate aminotransferase family protein [Candidatus Nezhaarchaeales archaeon]
MDVESLKKVEDTFLAGVYQKLPVVLVKGRGVTVWDTDGNEYVDCMGGYGVALAGHCHPKIVEAIKNQAEQLITCHGSIYNDARARFLEKLFKLTPKGLDKAYLCNSGAEAVECALKLARRYTGKRGFIAMNRAYHGKTMGALSATWDAKYRAAFEPLLQGFKFVPYGRIDKLREALTGEEAAVIVEPIQGESGVIIPPNDYLKQVRELCDEKGVLLICDEVQTGFGRTGRIWASEHWGVVPDIMCLAKPVGGGIPMGVTLAKSEVMDSFKKGEHTSTFGGNPLACAAASAFLDVLIEEKLVERAKEQGDYFKAKLESLKQRFNIVREVRGLGLMLASELRFNLVQNVVLGMLSKRVLILYSGLNTLRFLPPLVITKEQIDKACIALEEVLEEQSASLKAGI